jgi:hypothetical protein
MPEEKLCVNGCGKPVAPPSLVVCQDCLDRMTAILEAMVARFDDDEPNKGGDD